MRDGEDPPLAEGTRVGDFLVRSLLGEGAMGRVYLAEDLTLGRRIALKVIKRAAMEHDGLQRFLEEARATASFNHPHIVTLHAVGEHAGLPYLALEYIDGESLRALLAAGPLPILEALRSCRDVADAIAEAHRRGLVHADLKPENIVISRDGRVRVVDFGLARLAGGAHMAMSGTPAYMAPERWRGAPPTGAIDVWALGFILHELITGERPLSTTELQHVFFAATAPELSLLPDAPWAQLVRDCLALDPEGRPTAAVVRRRLTALLDQSTTPAAEQVHHAGAIATRMQYLTTVRAADASVTTTLRLTVAARCAGSEGDAWLAPVAERMMRRVLMDREDRRFVIADAGEDATRIELMVRRASQQIHIDAMTTGASGPQKLGSAAASSVADAVYTLAELLASKLNTGSAPVGPDAGELLEMRRIGAASVELYRRYRRVLHTLFATCRPDLPELASATRELIACDPAWAHPYALLIVIEGQTTDAARATIAAARASASAARDPSGMQILSTLDPAMRDPETAFHVMEAVLRRNDADPLIGSVLTMWALTTQRTEELVALNRRLHTSFPDLLFGVDLAEFLRRETRDGDAERLIREWVATTPDNLMARVELVRIEANAGDINAAREQARKALMIHLGRADVLEDLFEALVASDQISEARMIADRMLAGNPLTRAYGRYRVAMTCVFEGRFAAAYDAVRRAIVEHRAFGMQSELTQCLELARSIAPLVADTAAQRRHTEELVDVFSSLPDPVAAAATRFELALLHDSNTAPLIEAYLEGIEDESVRDAARRRMLRAAAITGHGSPQAAVTAGFSTFEDNTASLLALGLCARSIGELDLARRSFEQATRRWSSVLYNNQNSPYHAILARYHLASVLAELGEHAASRAAYEAFLRCWSSPDRPIPEVALARKAIEAAP